MSQTLDQEVKGILDSIMERELDKPIKVKSEIIGEESKVDEGIKALEQHDFDPCDYVPQTVEDAKEAIKAFEEARQDLLDIIPQLSGLPAQSALAKGVIRNDVIVDYIKHAFQLPYNREHASLDDRILRSGFLRKHELVDFIESKGAKTLDDYIIFQLSLLQHFLETYDPEGDIIAIAEDPESTEQVLGDLLHWDIFRTASRVNKGIGAKEDVTDLEVYSLAGVAVNFQEFMAIQMIALHKMLSSSD